MGKIILLLILGYFTYQYFLGEESGCDKYSSSYSCDYVENKASYDVYFWHNVENSDPNDEKYIGSVIGLNSCHNFATNYAHSINAHWNNRAYICVLKENGRNIEKHRL